MLNEGLQQVENKKMANNTGFTIGTILIKENILDDQITSLAFVICKSHSKLTNSSSLKFTNTPRYIMPSPLGTFIISIICVP
jgi:hypothetical protein